jgi:hypothetical protein
MNNIETLKWVDLNNSEMVTHKKIHLIKINSPKFTNSKNGQHTLVIRSEYALSSDFSYLEFNTQVLGDK